VAAFDWILVSMDQTRYDAALGAFLGACVGDAAGAVLEFFFEDITETKVEDALHMPGGGYWDVGPGQVTDDSELALCLAHGLAGSPQPPSSTPPLDDIAKWYGEWINSPPFDIGNTTRHALGIAGPKAKQGAIEGLGRAVQDAAAQYNQLSLSNGCLMRITPLPIWGCNLTTDELAAAARAETSLTHPNKVMQDATAAYCLSISHLINHSQDAAGAIAAAKNWLEQEEATEVLQWLQEALQQGPGPAVESQEGYGKWGFVHAFRALHLKIPYPQAIAHVLQLGGDTDTNAAIVGGLIGAYHGASGIPGLMKDPVLKRRVGSPGLSRPAFLQSCLVPELTEQLLMRAAGGGGGQ